MQDTQGNSLELKKFYEVCTLERKIPGLHLLKSADEWGYCFERFYKGKLERVGYKKATIQLRRYSDEEIMRILEERRAQGSWIESVFNKNP